MNGYEVLTVVLQIKMCTVVCTVDLPFSVSQSVKLNVLHVSLPLLSRRIQMPSFFLNFFFLSLPQFQTNVYTSLNFAQTIFKKLSHTIQVSLLTPIGRVQSLPLTASRIQQTCFKTHWEWNGFFLPCSVRSIYSGSLVLRQ